MTSNGVVKLEYNEDFETYSSLADDEVDEGAYRYDAYDGDTEEHILKCGEIIFSNNTKFCFTCTFCGLLLENIPDFFGHVLYDHLNYINDDHFGVDQLMQCLMKKVRYRASDSQDEKKMSACQKELNVNKRKLPVPTPQIVTDVRSPLLKDEPNTIPLSEEVLQIEKLDFIENFSREELKVKNEKDVEAESDSDQNSDACKEDYLQFNLTEIIEDDNDDDHNPDNHEEFVEMDLSEYEEEISKMHIEVLDNSGTDENEITKSATSNKRTPTEIESIDIFDENCDDYLSETLDDEKQNQQDNKEKRHDTNNPTRKKGKYECPECGKRFATLSGMQRHSNSHKLPANDFICHLCGKAFKSKVHVEMHMKRHLNIRPYPCEICGSCFADPSNLKVHVMRHKGIKPHHCQLCEKSFHSTTELKLHMRAHTGEKPFVCELCGKKFSNSGHLASHKRRHFNERRFKCELCDKRFFDSKLLRDHAISHTNERPFECSECKATFQRKKALLQHAQLHATTKRYQCKICRKSFAQNAGLYSHMKSHNHEIISAAD